MLGGCWVLPGSGRTQRTNMSLEGSDLTDRNLTDRSAKHVGSVGNRRIQVNSLPCALPDFLEPRSWIVTGIYCRRTFPVQRCWRDTRCAGQRAYVGRNAHLYIAAPNSLDEYFIVIDTVQVLGSDPESMISHYRPSPNRLH